MTQIITQQENNDTCSKTAENFSEELERLIEDAEVEICPECIPNQNYIEPNILYSEGSYYNEKNCRYVIDFAGEHSVSFVAQRYEGDFEKYVREHEAFNESFQAGDLGTTRS